ncbi:MAG: LPXTG cell wall anchor domain-containing protein [Erysipelotrichaceae bacterium]|jgi:LPXTG-motif cell wall-anchored protein|nr:LPXTG cell wall anchor domain-containing protein [Erysipelotrichaceae bacterium]
MYEIVVTGATNETTTWLSLGLLAGGVLIWFLAKKRA